MQYQSHILYNCGYTGYNKQKNLRLSFGKRKSCSKGENFSLFKKISKRKFYAFTGVLKCCTVGLHYNFET